MRTKKCTLREDSTKETTFCVFGNDFSTSFSSPPRSSQETSPVKIRGTPIKWGANPYPDPSFNVSEVRSNYQSWVYERVNLVFQDPDGYRRFFLSPKRGNVAYMNRVNRRFSALKQQIGGTNIRISDYTSLLYITCTLDQAGLTIPKAWETIGERWNSFVTKLRRAFGQIDIIRCFEAHEKGYPHIHALLFMPFHTKFFMHRNFRTAKKTYRMLDDGLRLFIKSKWSYQRKSLGFSDIQCIINLKYGLGYIFKYILKQNDATEKPTFRSRVNNHIIKHVTNYALLWHFSKRAYAVSRAFTEFTREQLRKSNPAVSGLFISPSYLPPSWEFLGIQTKNGFVSKTDFKNSSDSIYRKGNFSRMIQKVRLEFFMRASLKMDKQYDYIKYAEWLVNYGANRRPQF